MSAPAADPLRCVGCARPFGSEVPFCPFCGAAQRPELPAKRPPLKPVPLVPDTVHAVSPAAAIAPQPAPAPEAPQGPAPSPARPPVAPARLRPRRRARGRAWLVAALLAVGIGALVFGVRDPATARLVVHVHAANGAAVTAGQVLVNNHPAGSPGEALAVAPGTMTVSFVKTGWSVDPRTVSIAGHGALTVDLAARGLPGHLALSTQPPGAAVAFAGRTRGRTPFSADLDPGQYEISVALPG